MHNTRTRVDLAAWGSGAVTPSEFENLDQGVFASINGDDGGVWAPSSPIEIGGEGVLMQGPFECDDDATFNGQVTFATGSAPIFNDGPVFNNTATFNSDVNIGNAFTDILHVISTASFDNDVTIGATLVDLMTVLGESDFSGAAVFHGDVRIGVGTGEELQIDADVTINGNTDIVGDINMEGNIVLTGDASVSGEIAFSNSSSIFGFPKLVSRLLFDDDGRVPSRTVRNTTSATYGVEDCDHISAFSGSDRLISLDDTNAVSGDGWTIHKSGSATVTIGLPGAGTIALTSGNWVCEVVERADPPGGSGTWMAFAWQVDAFSNGV